MPEQREDRRALVCGGSSGIGRAIASRLAERCEFVCVTYAHNEAGAAQVASAIEQAGARAGTLRLDASEPEAMRDVLRRALASGGHYDIVVNCIGESRLATVCGGQMSAALRGAFEVNVAALVVLLEESLPQMAERGWGRFVQVSSVSALETRPAVGPYALTKAMQNGLIRFAAREVAGRNVCVNAIAPGMTSTAHLLRSNERLAASTGRTLEQVNADILAETWTKRMLDPVEIAQYVAFLCSEHARSIVGQTLVVAGGRG
jgi:NAD(P)-dependent dehydrogenase (short-subunit alcohol dehydrogenase family)